MDGRAQQDSKSSDSIRTTRPITAGAYVRMFSDLGVRIMLRGKLAATIIDGQPQNARELAWILDEKYEFRDNTYWIGGAGQYELLRHPGVDVSSLGAGVTVVADMVVSREGAQVRESVERLSQVSSVRACIWAFEMTADSEEVAGVESALRLGFTFDGSELVDVIDMQAAFVRSIVDSVASDSVVVTADIMSGRAIKIDRLEITQEDEVIVSDSGVVTTRRLPRQQGLSVEVLLYEQDDSYWVGELSYHDGRFVTSDRDTEITVVVPVRVRIGDSAVAVIGRKSSGMTKRGIWSWLTSRRSRSKESELVIGITLSPEESGGPTSDGSE